MRLTVTPDPVELLRRLGWEHRRSGSELRMHCPHPDHPRRPGPGSVQMRPSGDRACDWVCYSGCGAHGGPVAFVRLVLGVGSREAHAWIEREFGPGIPDVAISVLPERREGPSRPLPLPGRADPLWGRPDESWGSLRRLARSYVLGRGFVPEDLRHYRMRAVCARDVPYAQRLIIPVVVQGLIVDIVARLYVPAGPEVPKALSGRKSLGARKEFALWGYDDLDPGWPVVHVTEGIWGARAVLNAGLQNVVAACGSDWTEERTKLLGPWPTVVLIPDGDPAGARLETKAGSLRRDHEVLVVDLPSKAQPDSLVEAEGARAFRRRVHAARPARSAFELQVPRAMIRAWKGSRL